MSLALTAATMLSLTALLGAAGGAVADPSRQAIDAFNSWCFKAGQTEADARRNMNADAAEFTLTFWDDSLAPRPADAPKGVERRCEVAFAGAHTDTAIDALRKQMQTPPVFGTMIPLPETHSPQPGTALIEGRKLLRGRVAVVHVGIRGADDTTQTFMAVDRLYDGLGLTEGG